MNDQEIRKLCAEAIGVGRVQFGDGQEFYDPLKNDGQAMELDNILIDDHHSIAFHRNYFVRHDYPSGYNLFEFSGDMRKAENRRRARCECVAKMMKEPA